MELILIRHGMTPGNLERRFVGRLDQPLAPEGEALARAVAPTLPAVEHLYISPMTRCRQTADLLWPGVARTVIPELRETDFGPYEGRSHAELAGDPSYQRWLDGTLEAGESVEHCCARAARALEEIGADCAARGWKRAAVVGHGGVFMGMLFRFGLPARDYYGWSLPNCGGWRAELCREPLALHVTGRVGREDA